MFSVTKLASAKSGGSIYSVRFAPGLIALASIHAKSTFFGSSFSFDKTGPPHGPSIDCKSSRLLDEPVARKGRVLAAIYIEVSCRHCCMTQPFATPKFRLSLA